MDLFLASIMMGFKPRLNLLTLLFFSMKFGTDFLLLDDLKFLTFLGSDYRLGSSELVGTFVLC